MTWVFFSQCCYKGNSDDDECLVFTLFTLSSGIINGKSSNFAAGTAVLKDQNDPQLQKTAVLLCTCCDMLKVNLKQLS